MVGLYCGLKSDLTMNKPTKLPEKFLENIATHSGEMGKTFWGVNFLTCPAHIKYCLLLVLAFAVTYTALLMVFAILLLILHGNLEFCFT